MMELLLNLVHQVGIHPEAGVLVVALIHQQEPDMALVAPAQTLVDQEAPKTRQVLAV